jgi:phage tail-like protein
VIAEGGYLELDATTDRAALAGVVVEAAALRLAPVPTAPPAIDAVPGAWAVAVAEDGTAFVADPDAHAVVRVGPCGDASLLGCADGPSDVPGRVDGPRGIAVDRRGRIVVADTGNCRVQRFDARTGQLVGLGPEGLDRPVAVAVDAGGRLYVAEAAGIRRFGPGGVEDTTFAVDAPHGIAIVGAHDEQRLLVLSASDTPVLVLRLDGSFDVVATADWTSELAGLDPQQARLRIGGLTARAPAGPARLEAGHVVFGPLVAEPTQPAVARPTHWQRVRVRAEALPAGAWIEVFTCTTPAGTAAPPLPLSAARAGAERAPVREWRALPAGRLDGLALNAPETCLWVGVRLHGDGAVTPDLRGLRVEFDQEGLLAGLPAVYGRDPDSRERLERWLGLLGGTLDDIEEQIAELPALFDPEAARLQDGWLDWLGSWVALDDAVAAEPEAVRRESVASAFARHGRRGTVEALREAVGAIVAGPVRIVEPSTTASIWMLDGASALGSSTGLAAGKAQGAVLDTTAVLDGSSLIDDDDEGAPLFDDIAHCFCVELRAADVPTPSVLAGVEALVEREKPAHTVAHVRVVQPHMLVGVQSRVGIDAVVACSPRSSN